MDEEHAPSNSLVTSIRPVGMGRGEALARLSRFASSSLDDVLDQDGRFDLEKARATGAIDMVKQD